MKTIAEQLAEDVEAQGGTVSDDPMEIVRALTKMIKDADEGLICMSYSFTAVTIPKDKLERIILSDDIPSEEKSEELDKITAVVQAMATVGPAVMETMVQKTMLESIMDKD
jgi:hypothetical protein